MQAYKQDIKVNLRRKKKGQAAKALYVLFNLNLPHNSVCIQF